MAWDIKKIEGQYCVVKTGTDEKKGCHKTRGEAVDNLRALYASEADKSAYASFAKEDLEEAVNHLRMALESVSENDDMYGHLLEALAALGEEDQKEFDEFSNEEDAFEFSDSMKEYPWTGPIVFENVTTGDNRVFKSESINWQEDTLPWAFRWQKASGQGHAGSVPVGRVDKIERKEDGSIWGFGVVIPELSVEAAEYLKMLQTGVGGGVSVDGDSAQFEIQEAEGTAQPRVEFSSMRLRALSAVDIPAFNGARIRLIDAQSEAEPTELAEEIDLEELSDNKDELTLMREELAKKKSKRKKVSYGWSIDDSLTAAAIPVLPSTEAFIDPSFDGPTPLTVTPDGRVFGHLALFNTCHIGFPGTCVKPPKGSKYQYFHTGQIETAEGDLVDVGKLTFRIGHADMNATPRIAAEHYDNVNAVAADVRAGEDKFGIWVVGALRPHLTDEDIRAFRAAPLSGDWRRIAGKLELVGALGVNTPGFPVPRVRALVASGETETLFTFIQADDEEFIVSDYELGLRLDKRTELASKISRFLGEEPSESAPDDGITEEVPDAPTKKEIEARVENYSKNDLFADIKLVRDLLDDSDVDMPVKVRKGLEDLYDLVIKVDNDGKKFSYNGFELDIIENSGLPFEEWEEQFELSGLDVHEFYNQCHGEDGKFCEGKDGPGRVRDNVKGKHYIPGEPHGRDHPGHTTSPPGGGPSGPSGPGPSGPRSSGPSGPSGPRSSGPSGPGYSGPGSGGVDHRIYENYITTRKRATGWAAVATVAAAALNSPISPLLQGLAAAAGVSILANPAVLALATVTGVAYAAKNIAASRRHRADYNRQVRRKIARDKLNERQRRERERLGVST